MRIKRIDVLREEVKWLEKKVELLERIRDLVSQINQPQPPSYVPWDIPYHTPLMPPSTGDPLPYPGYNVCTEIKENVKSES